MIHSFQDLQIQHDESPELNQLIVHHLALFIGNFHDWFSSGG
jgi:hypothetical protein